MGVQRGRADVRVNLLTLTTSHTLGNLCFLSHHGCRPSWTEGSPVRAHFCQGHDLSQNDHLFSLEFHRSRGAGRGCSSYLVRDTYQERQGVGRSALGMWGLTEWCMPSDSIHPRLLGGYKCKCLWAETEDFPGSESVQA